MDDANLYDEIVSVARELYERSGRVEGRDLDNWLEAERIVISRYKEQEKRKYDRRPFTKIIWYTPHQHLGKSTEIVCKGITVDISERGLGMITDSSLKKGDVLFFEPEIKINGSTEIVASVKWLKKFEKDKYRVGLRTYL